MYLLPTHLLSCPTNLSFYCCTFLCFCSSTASNTCWVWALILTCLQAKKVPCCFFMWQKTRLLNQRKRPYDHTASSISISMFVLILLASKSHGAMQYGHKWIPHMWWVFIIVKKRWTWRTHRFIALSKQDCSLPWREPLPYPSRLFTENKTQRNGPGKE